MTFSSAFSAKRILLIIAVVAAVAGLIIAVISAAQPISFAWVAKAPLSGDVFRPGSATIVSGSTILGCAIMMVGLLGVAFWAGLTVGLRRRGRPEVAN